MEDVAGQIRARFDGKYRARENALQLSRSAIRDSANAIRAAHRGEFDRADELLTKASESVREIDVTLETYQDIYFAGFVQDAQKEYAEASITRALIAGHDLPHPNELQVGDAPYLNGLAEAVGELRRYLLDSLRRGEVGRCEEILQDMDDMYSLLITMDYPDAMTGGLRRTTDVARSILEKTRGDLTVALRQQQLELTLHEFESKLASRGDLLKRRATKPNS
ncbi:MAG: haloacid dehalogenase [Chloroflexi bacterium]|nr:haloacid dehalogenase [Chloroflexota bacterium]